MGNSIIFTMRGPWGIPVQIDATLPLLCLLVAFVFPGSPTSIAVFIGSLVLAIFLHELGLAAACVVQKIPVVRIVLFGGGGFCQHQSSATAIQQEFISIAGPLVNAALWAIATLSLPLLLGQGQPITVNGQTYTPDNVPTAAYSYVYLFAQINLFLGIFNMLPVLPLDGGRFLNAFLHRFMGGIAANKVTGTVGVVVGILWIPLLIIAFLTVGFILLFIPNIAMHWRMMKTGMG